VSQLANFRPSIRQRYPFCGDEPTHTDHDNDNSRERWRNLQEIQKIWQHCYLLLPGELWWKRIHLGWIWVAKKAIHEHQKASIGVDATLAQKVADHKAALLQVVTHSSSPSLPTVNKNLSIRIKP
jgi:hypothetical protein